MNNMNRPIFEENGLRCARSRLFHECSWMPCFTALKNCKFTGMRGWLISTNTLISFVGLKLKRKRRFARYDGNNIRYLDRSSYTAIARLHLINGLLEFAGLKESA